MNKYNDGKIYQLINTVDDEIYIGSTCCTLNHRLCGHKKMAKIQNSKAYTHLNNVGWNNVNIELIENFPCESKHELEKRERYYIEQMKPTLNSYIPTRTRTKKEYYEDTKERHKERGREYRRTHGEILRDNNRKYYQKNRDKLIAYQKEYATNNKEKVVQNRSIYYESNKDKILEWQRIKIQCPCGKEYTLSNKARHLKSKSHSVIININ